MKQYPLVSIIIPVFNEEKYISHCLKSLRNQSYKNIEIIVVDDGSTDNSKLISQRYTQLVYQQYHQGPGSARNMGVEHSKGEIIAFIDADMYLNNECIKYLISPIIHKNAVGTFIKDERVANTSNIWSQCWSINANLPFDKRLPENYTQKANGFRAIQKNAFAQVKGFDTNIGYTDDDTISKKLHIQAINAPGAIAYHFNPSGAHEVFYSSRWIGRSRLFVISIENFLRYSVINSIRLGIIKVYSGAPFFYIFFKIIYDFGMFIGIFLSGDVTDK